MKKNEIPEWLILIIVLLAWTGIFAILYAIGGSF